MRIATNTLQRSVVEAVQNNLVRIARAQSEVTTQKRVQIASDDPVAAAEIMQDSQELRSLTQYQRNLDSVRARSDAEESVLNGLTTLLERAQELAVAQGSDSASATTRQTAKAEVDRIIDQVVQLGNTTYGREYLFGGFQTGAAPFSAAGAYAGDAGVRQLEIGRNQFATANNNGQAVFVDSGVIASLRTLSDGLAAGTSTAVRNAINPLKSSFDNVQNLIGDVGGRGGQLDVSQTTLQDLNASVATHRSSRQDADFAQSTTELLAAQNALQAALASASRVLTTTLSQYLT
jgi:flagellar hook-associated protein 3 FlgL